MYVLCRQTRNIMHFLLAKTTSNIIINTFLSNNNFLNISINNNVCKVIKSIIILCNYFDFKLKIVYNSLTLIVKKYF